MNLDYPRSFGEIQAWATKNKILAREARVRFAQYGVLRAIADSRGLSSILVFKGGNALDFVWSPNRSTQDLDFSTTDANLSGERLRGLLDTSLAGVKRLLGIHARVQRIERQPPGDDKIFITYAVNVAFALQDEAKLQEKIAGGIPCPQIVPLDISLNEPICAHLGINIEGTNPLLVSTVEDILAEKLRSLLQQPIRNRHRKQDMLDIAVLLRDQQDIGLDRVASFLLRKAEARAVPVSRQAFRHPEIRDRARVDYDDLRQTTRSIFVPFEEAYATLLSLVDSLPIPEDLL
jgi:predicted nucleotidyltransferase component of viral defense system